jgi:hypothetical protein
MALSRSLVTNSIRGDGGGAPSRAIQELAGHRDLGTTQRYMHLSPAALEAVIRLLERGEPGSRGANGEAAGTSGRNGRNTPEKWWRRRESFCPDLQILEFLRKFEAVKRPKTLKNRGPGTKQVQ